MTAATSAPARRPMQIIAMLVVVVIWGCNFSVTKWALREFPPLAFTALRFVLASVLLLAALWWRERRLTPPSGGLLRLTVLGVVGNSIYQICFILGLSLTTVANSALVLASMPALVAGLGAALGIERLTRDGGRGLALASLGVILVVAARGVSFDASSYRGDALTLAAVACWAAFTLGVRRLSLPISPLAITTWTMVLGTPILVAVGLPSLVRMNWGAISPAGWAGLAYSSVLSLVVAYLLWNGSVRTIGSNRTAVFACITPLVAMGSAVLLLHERPTVIQLAGAAAILGGVLLSQRQSPAGRRG